MSNRCTPNVFSESAGADSGAVSFLAIDVHAAWQRARREKRTLLRLAPRCPWRPYVWSQCTTVRVRDDGRVPIGVDRIRLEAAPRTQVVLCQDPSGHYSVLAQPPNPRARPAVIFTDRPTPA